VREELLFVRQNRAEVQQHGAVVKAGEDGRRASPQGVR
jgi:hypothetical protein